MSPVRLRRAAQIAADALRAAEREGLEPGEIAAGFALALQRLPPAAWTQKYPAKAARAMSVVEQAVQFGRSVANLVEDAARRR